MILDWFHRNEIINNQQILYQLLIYKETMDYYNLKKSIQVIGKCKGTNKKHSPSLERGRRRVLSKGTRRELTGKRRDDGVVFIVEECDVDW